MPAHQALPLDLALLHLERRRAVGQVREVDEPADGLLLLRRDEAHPIPGALPLFGEPDLVAAMEGDVGRARREEAGALHEVDGRLGDGPFLFVRVRGAGGQHQGADEGKREHGHFSFSSYTPSHSAGGGVAAY